jgi:hypothetical protein
MSYMFRKASTEEKECWQSEYLPAALRAKSSQPTLGLCIW